VRFSLSPGRCATGINAAAAIKQMISKACGINREGAKQRRILSSRAANLVAEAGVSLRMGCMKTVRRFSNLAEAGFSKSLLEAAGLRTFLAGENNYSLGYGVGTGELLLQVEDEHFEHAMRVLKDGPDAEEQAHGFPAAKAVVDGSVNNVSRFPKAFFVAIAAALVVVLVVLPKVMEERRKRSAGTTEQTYEYDYDKDGRPDHFVTYANAKLKRATTDRNGDGKVDEWAEYDEEEKTVAASEDNNFDGKEDVWFFYRQGMPESGKSDTDFNGRADWVMIYENGLPARSDCIPNGEGPTIRREIYQHGVLREEWLDDDRDGTFDTKYTYDAFATRSAPIPLRDGK
jgi:hypothetical protein